jgi:hypothetical protein
MWTDREEIIRGSIEAMSDQKFYTKLASEEGQWWVECGIISNHPKAGDVNESGTVAFDEDRDQCLMKAADAMIREGIRLYGMVK